MALNIDREVAAMQRMTVNQLREKFAEVFGETDERPEQAVADQADRLADAGQRVRRPVRAGAAAGQGDGQLRRPAADGAAGGNEHGGRVGAAAAPRSAGPTTACRCRAR